MRIAVLIPICGRNQTWERLEDCYLIRSFMPRFEMTRSPAYTYQIYVGIDDDDAFFLRYADDLRARGFQVRIVSGCQHAPARVWNELFKSAVADGHEYFFQIGDDVILQSRKWTERFIEVLQAHGNKGVVGPCYPANFWGRKRGGGQMVIENAFVHRSHYDIFGTFFHPDITNWHCDDWITRVYEPWCAQMCEDIIVQNQCLGARYTIVSRDIQALVSQGRQQLIQSLRGCFSFCLFGDQDKYRKGLARNVEMIRDYYPTWDIRVYTAPDCEDFVRSLGVTTVATGESGFINVLYRFRAVLEDYDVVCVRDADSRIHARDRWCIQHFLESSFTMHTIRDHPYHGYRIMGGLWGIKRAHPLFTWKDIEEFANSPCKGYTSDTTFLEQTLSRKNMVVYSYDPAGILNDSTETVCVIGEPIRNHNFCGNVMMFTESGEVPEFTHAHTIE